MSDIERKALALLAKKYNAGGLATDAERIREGDLDRLERQAVQAIIAALTPPDGYLLVPVQPSFEMLSAAAEARGKGGASYEVWLAMIGARPEVK